MTDREMVYLGLYLGYGFLTGILFVFGWVNKPIPAMGKLSFLFMFLVAWPFLLFSIMSRWVDENDR